VSTKDDYLQRLEATLELEGGVSEPVLVQEFTPPRYGYIEIENTAINIALKPPPGKVWEILELGINVVCDANVANRVVTILITDKSESSIRKFIGDTLVASDNMFACFGTLPTGEFADEGSVTYLGAGPVYLWAAKDLSEYLKISVVATNKQVGDVLRLRAFYREVLDFNVRG